MTIFLSSKVLHLFNDIHWIHWPWKGKMCVIMAIFSRLATLWKHPQGCGFCFHITGCSPKSLARFFTYYSIRECFSLYFLGPSWIELSFASKCQSLLHISISFATTINSMKYIICPKHSCLFTQPGLLSIEPVFPFTWPHIYWEPRNWHYSLEQIQVTSNTHSLYGGLSWGMFGPKGYGFSAVLVLNRAAILAILVIKRARFLHSSLDIGMFLRRSHFSSLPKRKSTKPLHKLC